MKQALLYSIAPQRILNILNGNKTIEVRKRDLPQWAKDKLARGEIVEGYGYCTKGKPYLINHPYHSYMLIDDNSFDILNGRVVVKFEVSGVTKIKASWYPSIKPIYEITADTLWLMKLTNEQLNDYGNGKDLYAHHLTNIQPVNMELGEFFNDCGRIDTDENGIEIGWHDIGIGQLTKAPQSFQSAWVKA